MTLKTGLGVLQGLWKCHHAIEHIRLTIDVALSRDVSGILNVVKCRDREIGVRGPSSSLKVVPFDRFVYGFLLVFFSNIVLKRTVFDIRLQKCRDLETRVRGPSRS